MSDNVSNNNLLFHKMFERGNFRDDVDGGYEIVEPLEYAENSTFQRYSGYDTLNVAPSDVLSAAKFDWVQAAVHITASGRELRINNGGNRLINLVQSRINNAMNTMANNLSTDIYSDGTTANQIGGLQHIISDAGTGTVGGINSTTFSFWKSLVQSAASPLQGGGAITPSKSTIKSLMQPLWMEATRGSDKPDLIVADNVYYQYYWEALSDLQRYTDTQKASSGFETLKFATADVHFDGGSAHGGGIPSAHMYFINTKYMKFVVHPQANMTVMDEKVSVNQDAVVVPVLFQGQMTCSNRSLQGVVKA
jgi:hypothetical protein